MYHWRRHCEHHEKIGQSQVDDQKIAWCAETFGRGEDEDNHAISKNRNHTKNADDESNNSMPEWVHWWPLVPIGVNQMEHVRGHFIHDGLVPITASSASSLISSSPGFEPGPHQHHGR